jgi:hypothetical protein
VRYLPLLVLLPAVLLVACEAPPTQQQVTSRAVKRNCEAQGKAAGDEIRRQNAQVTKEGNAIDPDEQYRVETRASKVEKDAFKECMFQYSV